MQAKILKVRYSGGAWLCDVEVNGKIYKDVMASVATIRSGDKNLILKDIAERLYNLINRDKPVSTPIDGAVFDIEELKDYMPPSPPPPPSDPVQKKKMRLQEILSKKDTIKKAIEDSLISADDPLVKGLMQEAKTLISELKEMGENPFE